MPDTWSEEVAAAWLAADNVTEMLDLPRKIAASVVALSGGVQRVLDIASGPGTFLKVFLDAFPHAQGIWQDGSDTMLKEAKIHLANYSDRISWNIGNMAEIASSGIQPGIDVVLSSRASHHMTPEELRSFYADVATLVRPGGWLVNLDHIQMPAPWEDDFRTARKHVIKRKEGTDPNSGHKHERKAPFLQHHLDSLTAAGFSQITTGWQAFYTYLIMARKG
ncbi:MAG: class I SAM-dependent methyltransferase [Actinobacteria bacterium]|jgi:trans-aconitate methyltransferase|nr:class I SAM-dependent methyltransferase [Actinomycetota bacterium]